jgi:DNA-binding winged helix-turn-helix (wHTH) protein/Tfp pilus assembly protein PilF
MSIPHARPGNLQHYVLDDLRIDLERQRVQRGGEDLEVSGLSFRLLACLLRHGTEVVGFDALIDAVWAPALVNPETVTQRVKLLRQALGDDGRQSRYIRTVRGRGYQLCVQPRAGGVEPAAIARRHWPTWAALAAVLAVAAVSAWLFRPPQTAETAAPAVDPRLQRARYYAGIGQQENNERAIALYEQLLADQPRSVEARLELSRALSARVCLYNAGPDSVARAQALAQAVLAETPDDSLAHDALAYAYDCQGELHRAIAEYERAIALAPQARMSSRASVANLYLASGRIADALEADVAVQQAGVQLRFLDLQIARALELLGFSAAAEQRYATLFRLYPDNVFVNVAYPRFLFTQGRLDEAQRQLQLALQRPPHPELFVLQGEIALLRDAPDAARASFAQAVNLRPHQGLQRTLLAILGGLPDAVPQLDAHLAELRQNRSGEYMAPMEAAFILAAREDHRAAVAALEAAVDAGLRDQAYLRTTPLLRGLAGDPGFARVLDRIGQAVARERAQVLAAGLPETLFSAAAPPGG